MINNHAIGLANKLAGGRHLVVRLPDDIIISTLDNENVFKNSLIVNCIMDENFNNYKSVGDGVFELRFFFGAGYRVYFAFDGENVILLLCGGDKSTQNDDIKKAKEYLKIYFEYEKRGDKNGK